MGIPDSILKYKCTWGVHGNAGKLLGERIIGKIFDEDQGLNEVCVALQYLLTASKIKKENPYYGNAKVLINTKKNYLPQALNKIYNLIQTKDERNNFITSLQSIKNIYHESNFFSSAIDEFSQTRQAHKNILASHVNTPSASNQQNNNASISTTEEVITVKSPSITSVDSEKFESSPEETHQLNNLLVLKYLLLVSCGAYDDEENNDLLYLILKDYFLHDKKSKNDNINISAACDEILSCTLYNASVKKTTGNKISTNADTSYFYFDLKI